MFAQCIPYLSQKGKKVVWGLCLKVTLSLFSCPFVIFVIFFYVAITKCNSAVLRTHALIYDQLAFINVRTNKLGVSETCKSGGNF